MPSSNDDSPIPKSSRLPFADRVAEAISFARAYAVSYGIPGWRIRLNALYRSFVRPGSLCFDLGSHLGNRIDVWRALGAKVVAVEPQPRLYRYLQTRYGRDNDVTLIRGVVSDREGPVTFYHNSKNNSLSTIDRQWIEEKRSDPAWDNARWDREWTVDSTTLDALIARYGTPDFCKIDVEGAELSVLSALSAALPCLSFEYITTHKSRTIDCIERLERLARYEYNWTFSEFSAMKSSVWLTASQMIEAVRGFGPKTFSGDVYARTTASTPNRSSSV